MAYYRNSAEGGTDGVAVTVGNSGGASGDAWTLVSVPGDSSVVYDDTEAAHGDLSLLVTPTSGTAPLVGREFEATDTLLLSFYVRFDSSFSTTSMIAQVRHASGPTIDVRASGSLNIQFHGPGGQLYATTGGLSADTWYRIELRLIRGSTTSNGTAQGAVYVGDSTDPSGRTFSTTTANTGEADYTQVRLGRPQGSADATPAWVDSVQIWTGGDVPEDLGHPYQEPVEPVVHHGLVWTGDDWVGVTSLVFDGADWVDL